MHNQSLLSLVQEMVLPSQQFNPHGLEPGQPAVGLLVFGEDGALVSNHLMASTHAEVMTLSPCSALKAALAGGSTQVLVWTHGFENLPGVEPHFLEFLSTFHAGCCEFGLGVKLVHLPRLP